ncbi:FAD:protein FMN transferase [Actinocatenispora thailandica]|uniref:FAD:protein FMN transferase n=1 Tax=Actinocatenispora thailandica TaxID=227318 RepID=A0A7R7DM42_9ACTN|nr:FAD:protein FMN transferase [Actinocatenispora thailandica]BCJ34200.1 FAD:protein FMN transferase [Actinocatenispora thailandica]
MTPTARFPRWGGTVVVATVDRAALSGAVRTTRTVLSTVDRAASRFRPDSEVRRVEAAGDWRPVGAVLAELVTAALRVAAATDGLVDPTVSVADLGYDRDIAALPPEVPARPVRPAPGWTRIGWRPAERLLRLPPGVRLDLGATAKALTADRAAERAARRYGSGTLVAVGGDVSVAGGGPVDGWRVAVGDDHERPAHGDPVVAITGGGLATSGVTRRRWQRDGVTVHHIVDPRTGRCAAPCWRTVTVAAGSCLDANAASTAAIVRGAGAAGWLAEQTLPARLVDLDGRVTTVAGWPA